VGDIRIPQPKVSENDENEGFCDEYVVECLSIARVLRLLAEEAGKIRRNLKDAAFPTKSSFVDSLDFQKARKTDK
jgi:hypothetical protein